MSTDTITVARDRKPFPHKLIDMMYHYHTHPDANFHRADVDVSVLIEVFYSMLHEKTLRVGKRYRFPLR